MNKPKVSVIIVNWNGGEVFKECLYSLSKINYPRWELIVVDNGSFDGSQHFAKKCKLIKNAKNLGFALANNQGIKLAKGKYVLLLNNDTKVQKDFLSKLVQRLEQNKTIGVIQPKIYLMDKKGFLDNAGSFLTRIGFFYHWGFMEKDGEEYQKEREIFSAKGACMLIRSDVIKKVGLFDDDFFAYFEESDFCWRVWLAGFKVLFYPDAKIFHKLGYTIRRLNVKELNYHYYKNRICSLIKNLSGLNLINILIPHLIISELLSLIFLIRGQFKYSYMIQKACFWNLWNLQNTLSKRGKIQKFRILSDRQLFRTALYPINFSRFFNDFRRVEDDLERKQK